MSNSIAKTLGASKNFKPISEYYAYVPSAVIIRIAEAELLQSLTFEEPILDLCCGDGFFSSLIFSKPVSSGCDMDRTSLIKTKQNNTHDLLILTDVEKSIPYKDSYFNTVVSNSSLEHIENIDTTIEEISRILNFDGLVIFTLASDFAYQWWPLGNTALLRYKQLQPVYNWFSLDEWKTKLANNNLNVVHHEYYLDRPYTQLLLLFDFYFSHAYNTNEPTIVREIIKLMHKVKSSKWSEFWHFLFSRIPVLSSNIGGGILIIAQKGNKLD